MMYEENARKINSTLEAINPAASQDIIPLGRMGSMLQARDKLDEGYLVGMLADRGLGDDATVDCDFLGKPAPFPLGPFRMAAMLRRPVFFMTGLYLGGNRYQLHFEPLADFSQTTREERDTAIHAAMQHYADRLTHYCHLALDKPVVSSGEMSYTAPDRLEKRTLVPKVETLLLDKDMLSIEREKQKLSINLANQPEALAFVDSIRGTLSGNRAALEKNYALHLSGHADKWVLTLLPSDQKISALVLRITVSGSKSLIRSIEYLQADGDRSVLNMEPIETK